MIKVQLYNTINIPAKSKKIKIAKTLENARLTNNHLKQPILAYLHLL
jgi:hypothetical protein